MVVVFVALFLLLGVGLLPLVVILLLGAAGVAMLGLAVRKGGAGMVLAATAARPTTEADQPRLHNLLDGLCVGVGIPKPGLWVVDDPVPNALAVARTPDEAAIVVTSAVARDLSRIEVEAVLAHQLGRIRRGDAVAGAAAVVTLTGPALLSAPPGGWSRGVAADGLRPAPGAFGMAPVMLAAPLVRLLATRNRAEADVALADQAAIEITRYPPGLQAALEKVPADAAVPAAASPATGPLWLVGPPADGPAGDAIRRVYEVRRPVAERIEVLQEL